MTDLQKNLFSMADEKYKDFQSALIPTVEKEKIIGIRIPVLRKFAKSFYKTEEAKDFIKNLPHEYYEENNLHAFMVLAVGTALNAFVFINGRKTG